MSRNTFTRVAVVVAATVVAAFTADIATANATEAASPAHFAPALAGPRTIDTPHFVDGTGRPKEYGVMVGAATHSPAVPSTTVAPAGARNISDSQADIQNALNQAGNDFMTGATAGSMIGGAAGIVGGCAIGAVVGLIGGCIPGLLLGAAVGPIIGGMLIGVPALTVGLVQAYGTLHAAGEIAGPMPQYEQRAVGSVVNR